MVGCRGYFLSIVCLMLASQALFAQLSAEPICNIYYVDQNATGLVHDGSSWCSAFLSLSDALLVADGCDTIRVAGGTYTPSTLGVTDPREATFDIFYGVTLEGGYQGCDGVSPDTRDIGLYETLLSGDLNGDDSTGNRDDNAFNVVRIDNAQGVVVIDGFSIANGHSVGLFRTGGGIFIDDSSVIIRNSHIYDNDANSRGGGIYIVFFFSFDF